MSPAVHTVYLRRERRWTNRVGGRRCASSSPLKERAVLLGRALARELRLEHHVHRRDGAVTARNSYGNDRRDRKG